MVATGQRRALRHVLFVSRFTRPEDASRLYRCVYQGKQLKNAGVTSEVVHYQKVEDGMIDRADVVVFARCLWSKTVVDTIRKAQKRGALVVGELDDKIFEPWDVSQSGFLRSLRGAARDLAAEASVAAAWRDALRLLPFFDVVLVSTEGLKDALRALGIEAHVSRNALDTEVFRPVRRERTALTKLLVMSGTNTHDADLRLIADPLARFLSENRAITCTFLGPIHLPTALLGLPNVTAKARVAVAELCPLIAEHDLCLVPLEDTVFNDCKSAIKFLECGIVSVPVLASPRREFQALIREGETGFFADDQDAFYRTLCRLRDEPSVLDKVAQRAHEEVLSHHTLESRGSMLKDYLSDRLESHMRKSARRGVS